MTPRRIDAHQHFWQLARGDYEWLTPSLAPLYRDFAPTDLAPLLRARGIAGCIAVQAAESVAETEHLLRHARAHPWIEGVVGWVNVHSPTAVEDAQRLRTLGPLAGVRPMLQDREPGWILDHRARPCLAWLEGDGLCLDALVRPIHLAAIDELMARHPGLRVVIDHAAKPDVRAGAAWRGFASWARGMAGLARRGAWVKLSGLLTEAGEGATAADLRAVFDALVQHFGPERMLWGSDWPVLLCAASYSRWCDVTDELLAGLSAADRAQVLGGAAARFYHLSAASAAHP